jgi:cardiolipin synthase
MLRIVLIPIIVIGLLQGALVWPLVVFIFCAATDVLDGAVARWRGEKTLIGSYLDPLADKLLLISMFLTLAHLNIVPMWVFVVTFSRDLFILLGWTIIYLLTRHSKPTPRWLGKITTFAQMATVITLLSDTLYPFHDKLIWAMVAVTVLSTFDYIWVGVQRLSEIG